MQLPDRGLHLVTPYPMEIARPSADRVDIKQKLAVTPSFSATEYSALATTTL